MIFLNMLAEKCRDWSMIDTALNILPLGKKTGKIEWMNILSISFSHTHSLTLSGQLTVAEVTQKNVWGSIKSCILATVNQNLWSVSKQVLLLRASPPNNYYGWVSYPTPLPFSFFLLYPHIKDSRDFGQHPNFHSMSTSMITLWKRQIVFPKPRCIKWIAKLEELGPVPQRRNFQ